MPDLGESSQRHVVLVLLFFRQPLRNNALERICCLFAPALDTVTVSRVDAERKPDARQRHSLDQRVSVAWRAETRTWLRATLRRQLVLATVTQHRGRWLAVRRAHCDRRAPKRCQPSPAIRGAAAVELQVFL